MSRPLWKTFALVIAGIVLSVPLAAILETLASFSLAPGSLVIYYLGPEGGLLLGRITRAEDWVA